MTWHTSNTEAILQELQSTTQGLTQQQAAERLQQYGRNELATTKKASALSILWHQFKDVMILVLLAAAVISAFIGEAADTLVIVVIIVVNAIIGFVQEYRAEKAMEALQKMAAQSATVLRDGQPANTAAAELVPGDIVLLEAGNTVPADVRLLEAHAFKVNEASLTGESNAVDKNTPALQQEDIPLGDRLNMAYKGTHITNGNAKAVVVATGMQTELGHIAGMLESADSMTPLQKRLAEISKRLTFIIIGLCVIFFVTGYLRGQDFNTILLTSISLAVAAIPEALPAVVTVALALGARRLMQKNVLIRKLQAVETLGSVTFICTDKTGTLTRNEMVVQETWVLDEAMSDVLMQAMASNHDVKQKDGELHGDPTELAMVNHAGEQTTLKRVKEIPFDSDRKAMTTIHEKEDGYWVVTKGAAESVVEMLTDTTAKEHIEKELKRMSAQGMRVIAFAAKHVTDVPDEVLPENTEHELEFIGLAGLIDPPRDEAKQAIEQCKTAGINPVMITGDHPLTATYIARELGILDNETQKAVSGKELQALQESELQQQVENIRVYARVSPEQKLQIVTALQNNGQFVSMTGDGVNDAPSLKKANIGVAMGITGTDVTKEAAHMILLDDNFTSIINAVKEGRRIYDNIRKFIRYILTGNMAEICTLFFAPLIGLPIPLLPVHILWINLITDGLPALALATEPMEKNVMQRPPRHPNESIFAKGLGVNIIWAGLFISLLTLGTQYYAAKLIGDHWQTEVFSVLCFAQLWLVLGIKSETESVFTTGLLNNKPLLLAVLFTALLQLAVIYVPFFNSYFHTQPLTLTELLSTIGLSAIVLLVTEIQKIFLRKRATT